MAVTIIAREAILTATRIYLLPTKLVIPASNFGKAKTVVQSIAIVSILLKFNFSWYVMLAAVLLTLISGIEYLVRIRGMTGNKVVNMPNLITLMRFLFIIPFVYYTLKSQTNLSLIFFAAITLSDKLDGLSARLMKQTTKVGSFFDSLTDWIFLTAAILVGVYIRIIPMAIFIALLVLSILVAIIKLHHLRKHNMLLTSILSKITVGFSYITILAILINFVYKDILIIASLVMLFLMAADFFMKSTGKIEIKPDS